MSNEPRSIHFVSTVPADWSKLEPLARAVRGDVHLMERILFCWPAQRRDYGGLCGDHAWAFAARQRGTFEYAYCATRRWIHTYRPDMVVVHGDTYTALAAACAAAGERCRICHVEGGDVSGSLDEHYRHAITKLAHLHCVSNARAARRLLQMGERADRVWSIGSANVDKLRGLAADTMSPFDGPYGLICVQPVTTHVDPAADGCAAIVGATAVRRHITWIMAPTNGEPGSEELRSVAVSRGAQMPGRVPHAQMLAAIRGAQVVVGNSSAVVYEAPAMGTRHVVVGSRQRGRSTSSHAIDGDAASVQRAVRAALDGDPPEPVIEFGGEDAPAHFVDLIRAYPWDEPVEKGFVDRD